MTALELILTDEDDHLEQGSFSVLGTGTTPCRKATTLRLKRQELPIQRTAGITELLFALNPPRPALQEQAASI